MKPFLRDAVLISTAFTAGCLVTKSFVPPTVPQSRAPHALVESKKSETLRQERKNEPHPASRVAAAHLPVADEAVLAIDKARKIGKAGNLEEAARLLQVAMARSPDNAELQAEMGALERHRNNPAHALAFFRKALGLDPKQTLALQEVVATATSASSEVRREAESLLAETATQNPNTTEPQNAYADLLYRTNQARKARQHFENLEAQRRQAYERGQIDEKSVDQARIDYALALSVTGDALRSKEILQAMRAKYPEDRELESASRGATPQISPVTRE